jgi:outer membrane lipoprotein-sorting protein
MTRYRQHFLDKDVFIYVPDVRQVSNTELPEITDEALFKWLQLTREEIQSIIGGDLPPTTNKITLKQKPKPNASTDEIPTTPPKITLKKNPKPLHTTT